MARPPINTKLQLENIVRTKSLEEESNELYQPLPVQITLEDGRTVVYDDITTGHTVDMVRFRVCEEFDLPHEATKLYWGSEWLIDPLSFNDFPFLSNREPGVLKLTAVVDDTKPTAQK